MVSCEDKLATFKFSEESQAGRIGVDCEEQLWTWSCLALLLIFSAYIYFIFFFLIIKVAHAHLKNLEIEKTYKKSRKTSPTGSRYQHFTHLASLRSVTFFRSWYETSTVRYDSQQPHMAI